MTIKTQEHFGKRVWTNVEMDELRRTECLCLNCDKLMDDLGHCFLALVLYAIAEKYNMAFMVTRCKRFKKIKET